MPCVLVMALQGIRTDRTRRESDFCAHVVWKMQTRTGLRFTVPITQPSEYQDYREYASTFASKLIYFKAIISLGNGGQEVPNLQGGYSERSQCCSPRPPRTREQQTLKFKCTDSLRSDFYSIYVIDWLYKTHQYYGAIVLGQSPPTEM